jgi:hypothetical protein
VGILDQAMHIVRQPRLVRLDKLVKRRAISGLGPQHDEALAKLLEIFLQFAQCR